MFSQMVSSATNWHPNAAKATRNSNRKIGDEGERRILRMAKAGYSVHEACEMLGTYNYSTIRTVYKKHGFDTKGWWR